MANSIPDIDLTDSAWQNIYALSGITVGKAVTVQNKGSVPVYLQTRSTQPAANARDGYMLMTGEQAYIEAGESGLWGIGDLISVQEVAP